MFMRKIASGLRLESTNTGTVRWFQLPAMGGGRMCKYVGYSVKVLDASDAAARVELRCDHGPDGQIFNTLVAPIVAGNPGASYPSLVSGDTTTTNVMVNDFIQPLIGCTRNGGGGTSWIIVDAWELRKPF